jgi:hypothetical protein
LARFRRRPPRIVKYFYNDIMMGSRIFSKTQAENSLSELDALPHDAPFAQMGAPGEVRPGICL